MTDDGFVDEQERADVRELDASFQKNEIQMSASHILQYVETGEDDGVTQTFHPHGLNHHWVNKTSPEYLQMMSFLRTQECTTTLIDRTIIVYPYMLQGQDEHAEHGFPVLDMRLFEGVNPGTRGRQMTESEYAAMTNAVHKEIPLATAHTTKEELRQHCIETAKIGPLCRFAIVEGMHRMSALAQVLYDTEWRAPASSPLYLMNMQFSVIIMVPSTINASPVTNFQQLQKHSQRIMENKTKVVSHNICDVLSTCLTIIANTPKSITCTDGKPAAVLYWDSQGIIQNYLYDATPAIWTNLSQLWKRWAEAAGRNIAIQTSRIQANAKVGREDCIFLTKINTSIRMNSIKKADKTSTGKVSGTFTRAGYCYEEFSIYRYLSSFLISASMKKNMLDVHNQLVKKNMLSFRTIGKTLNSCIPLLIYLGKLTHIRSKALITALAATTANAVVSSDVHCKKVAQTCATPYIQLDIMKAFVLYGDGNDPTLYPENPSKTKHWKKSPKLIQLLQHYRDPTGNRITTNPKHECFMHVLMEFHSDYVQSLHDKANNFQNGWHDKGTKASRSVNVQQWSNKKRDILKTYQVPHYGMLPMGTGSKSLNMPITFTSCLYHLIGKSDNKHPVEDIPESWSMEAIFRTEEATASDDNEDTASKQT